MSAQLLGKAFSKEDSQRLVSTGQLERIHTEGMSSDSRKVDSKVLDQMRLRGKEQVFRRIHVVPYGEREAWSQFRRRKSASKHFC